MLGLLASPVSGSSQMPGPMVVREAERPAPAAFVSLVLPELAGQAGVQVPGEAWAYPRPRFLDVAELQERRRPWWQSPLIGFGVGAAVGGAYGLYRDSDCGGEDNWFCGTYTVSYAVIGGVVGGALGFMADASRD